MNNATKIYRVSGRRLCWKECQGQRSWPDSML